MMFSKKSIFFLAFCLTAGAFYYVKSEKINSDSLISEELESHDDRHDHDHSHGDKKTKPHTQTSQSTHKPKVKLDPKLGAHGAHDHDPHKMGKTVQLPPLAEREAFEPVSEQERSLATMSNEILRLVQEGRSHGEFIEFLKKNELAPRVADTKNEHTGGMIMVRSDKSLPGTRYYHAQFFKGEQGDKTFAQHVSFETPAGPNAFARAQQAAEVLAVANSKVYSVKGNFVQYKLEDCNVLWIKVLDANDLKYDIYNAYSQEDIGTVRTAIEQDIHCTE